MSRKKSYYNDKYTVVVELTVESSSADDAQDFVTDLINSGIESLYDNNEDIGEIKYEITSSEPAELFES